MYINKIMSTDVKVCKADSNLEEVGKLMFESDCGALAVVNATEQATLRAIVAARESFLDFEFVRTKSDGSKQTYLVSGQPMFDSTFQFIGYCGIGVDISARGKHQYTD